MFLQQYPSKYLILFISFPWKMKTTIPKKITILNKEEINVLF